MSGKKITRKKMLSTVGHRKMHLKGTITQHCALIKMAKIKKNKMKQR